MKIDNVLTALTNTALSARRFASIAVLATIALCTAPSAFATPITSSSTGLAGYDVLIDFSEVGIANDTPMAAQFDALGVSDFRGLWYNGCAFCPTAAPDGVKPDLTNFFSGTGFVGSDFSMSFTDTVTEAAFAIASSTAPMTVTAWMGATVVDLFSVAINGGSTCNGSDAWCYYGFQGGSAFDSISVQTSNLVMMDNLQFSWENAVVTASVPEPGSFGLVAAMMLAAMRRRGQA